MSVIEVVDESSDVGREVAKTEAIVVPRRDGGVREKLVRKRETFGDGMQTMRTELGDGRNFVVAFVGRWGLIACYRQDVCRQCSKESKRV